MQHRAAAVLLVLAGLLAGLGWSGESCAQTKIPRVGILTFERGLTGDQASQ